MIDETMPLLVFGGPYSNLQATEAMRAEAERLQIPPGNVVCTGDVVAYAAEPEETASLVRDWGIAVVAGNCEEQLAEGAADCGCGFDEGSACDLLSRGWYPYALAHVSDQTRDWMRAMPGRVDFSYAGLRFAAIHGGVHQVNRFIFASEAQTIDEEFSAANSAARCDIVLAGHCGIPFTHAVGDGLWLNAGVIGMPANDGSPDGWYALIKPTDGGLDISLRRLAYDYVAAAAAMRRAGHANGYARTMVTGIWPSHDVLPDAERAMTGTRLRQKTVRFRTREAALT